MQLLGVIQQGEGNLEIIYIIKNILKSDRQPWAANGLSWSFWSLVS